MKNPYYICDRLISTFKIHFMNKILRFSLIAVLSLISSVSFAQQATFDWSTITTTTVASAENIYTAAPITLTFAKGTGSSWPSENKEGSIRMYVGSTLEIQAAAGYVISKVVFTTISGYSASNLTFDGVAISDDWTPAIPAQDFILTGTANTRIKTMVVTYTPTSTTVVNAPTISGNSTFIGTTQITLTGDAGTSIYYTTDGNTPTNASSVYSAPFTIDATKTIMAIAYKDANASTVSSKTFTKAVESSDIADFASQSNGTVANLALANAQVLYADATNKNVYVKDATGALCFYNAGLNLTTGDILNGSVAGKLSIYNNLPEFTANTLTSVDKITKTAGAAPTPVDITVAQANSMQYVSQLVRLSGVKLDSVGSNLMAIQNGDSIQIYDSFKSLTGVKLTTPSENNNLTGILIIYKTTYEIYPLTIDGYETASISNVNGVSNLNAPIYNLAGQQVNESYKGVVTRNGKKFIQK